MNFLNFLVKKGVITPESVSVVEQYVASGEGEAEESLIKSGVKEEDLLHFKGEYLNVPIKELKGEHVPNEILKYIPEESAGHYKFVPLAVTDGVLEVGFVDPENLESTDALQFISSKIGMPFKIFLISQADFKSVIERYSGITGEVGKALTELSGDVAEISDKGVEMSSSKADTEGQSAAIVEDAPVTKMVAVILRHAAEGNASDIHIENMGEKIRVRFRVDGTLYTSLFLPAAVHPAIVSRVKILASLKLDEKRKPQDGRFSARIDSRKIDFRVSTFPSYYGEKVVLRILDSEKGILTLSNLGMKDSDLETVREAIKRPYGMILLSGPTGSGKSTTLYAMLNELDRDSDNVLSLEDPVEYSMPGVSQSQVQPEIGYTFASGLRSVLRQDPDIIMVGEIRDKETAQLAVQAALTGHLVLSTLHTNTSTGVVTRLIDMGVDPYLIAPTLILAIGQRLVGKMCPAGRKEIPLTGAMKLMVEKNFEDLPEKYRSEINVPEKVYEATPCAGCPSGTKGRLAVFELFKIDSDVQEIILKNPNEVAIHKIAREKGMLNLKEDAMIKAFNGEIAFMEVNKL
ncbi:MAG: GspE/PulE family protein [Candidatus Paceibacterota bacterium]|jgi:type IV pilus assembly protein PilB|nr:GspE/PulE family protein [Candidatus Paceibacterota bacterium]